MSLPVQIGKKHITAAPATSIAAGLRVVASPNPFSDRVTDVELPAGPTIEELIRLAGADRALLAHAHVYIVDRAMTREAVYIPRELWRVVRPKPGMHLSIRVVASPEGGGGGGGKNPLRTILTIAVIVAAFYVGGLTALQFGGFTLPGTATTLYVGQILGAVAVTLVGNAIVNAVAPIQPAKLSEVAGLNSTTSPTLSITGSQNRIQAGAPVTTVIGEARLFPMMRIDAPPYTEAQGADQYLRQMFDLGYGPLEMGEERIGTVPLAQYEGVESDFRPGTDDDTPPTLYTNTIRQDGYSVRLTAGVPRTLVSRIDADEVTGDLSFQGLTAFDTAGNPGGRTVEVKIEYRASESGDPLTLAGVEAVSAATTSLHTHPFRIVMPARGRYDVVFTRLTADNTSTQIRDDCIVSALRTVTYSPPAIPKGRSVKTLRIRATNQLNGIVQSYNCVPRRLFPVWDGEAWSEPVFTRNPAWVALGLLRLGRRGNAKPQPDSRIDLATWLAFAQRNDVLDQNGEPMFRVSGVIDTRGTVTEVVNLILATARAWLDRTDGKLSVGWDRPQETAAQMFTSRNSWGFDYQRNFIDLPHALRGTFINPEKDWQQDEVVIYRDGFDATTATEIETIEYFLVDRASQVWRDLKYRWAEALLRPAKYFLNADMEHLQCRRGSKVRVANRLMRWGLGEGRIKALEIDGGGNVTALTLDETLLVETGRSYALRVRRADSTQIMAHVVTPGASVETRTLSLSPAIAAAEAPETGDLVEFGAAGGLETVSLIVRSIARLDDLDARLELVDEAPAVHTADQGTLPVFSAQQTFAGRLALAEPPQPTILDIVSDERAMVPSPGGGWVQGIEVLLAPQSGIAVDVGSIEGRFRRKGSAEPWSRATAPAFASRIRLAPVEEGVEYEFTLIATSAARPGVVSPATYVGSHLVMGRMAIPARPATVTLNGGILDAPGYQAPIDFLGFKVSYKLGDDRVAGGAASAHPAVPTVTLPFDVSRLPAGTVTLFIVAVDSSFNESEPAIVVKDIAGPGVDNIVEAVDFRALGWPGTLSGGEADAGDLAALNLAPFISADDAQPLVPGVDSAAYIPADEAGSFTPLVYVASFEASSAWVPARLTLERDIEGLATIEVRTDGDDGFVPADDGLPFISGDDEAPFVPDLGAWRPWPGSMDLAAQSYQFRASVAGGPARGRIRGLAAVADVIDVEEHFLNFAVAAGGTRLPLAKSYRHGVVDVGLTLLGDGGAAVSARAVIDGLAPGPLIECTSIAGALIAGHVNAHPKGY
ncbi:TipJ family phage tail tip protein [Shumkonia mesophila]|uniref:TipJ family phage tail tip protein n=1 Tax=Shumkonia mesophila TaxID=2838854 RepID=UPI002934D103|nr:hypothetical protein [Shumkonia mesophila]